MNFSRRPLLIGTLVACALLLVVASAAWATTWNFYTGANCTASTDCSGTKFYTLASGKRVVEIKFDFECTGGGQILVYWNGSKPIGKKSHKFKFSSSDGLYSGAEGNTLTYSGTVKKHREVTVSFKAKTPIQGCDGQQSGTVKYKYVTQVSG